VLVEDEKIKQLRVVNTRRDGSGGSRRLIRCGCIGRGIAGDECKDEAIVELTNDFDSVVSNAFAACG
jgi:hypothetical protein